MSKIFGFFRLNLVFGKIIFISHWPKRCAFRYIFILVNGQIKNITERSGHIDRRTKKFTESVSPDWPFTMKLFYHCINFEKSPQKVPNTFKNCQIGDISPKLPFQPRSEFLP